MKLHNVKIPRGTYIGLDMASKTGYAVVVSDGTTAKLVAYGSIKVPFAIPEYERCAFVEAGLNPILRDWITPEQMVGRKATIVIENCFLKHNPKTFKVLSQLGAWMARSIIGQYKKSTIIHLIYPTESRKLAGVKGRLSKEGLVNFVNNLLGKKVFEEVHNNITDAVILAIAGGNVKC